MTSIWWIRRDLRLADNAALQAARAEGPVIPVFILDPCLLARQAARRQAFLFAGLHALDAALRQRGSYLVVRKGDPLRELHDLLAEAGASGIFAEEDFTPFARKRDSQVSQALPLHLLPGETVQHPGLLLKQDGMPYTVYSPYSRKWKARLGPIDLIPAPESIDTPAGVRSEPLPAAASDPRFPAGEEEALTRLEEFTHRKIHSYAADRDRVDLDGTSALSPYLRFGMLGIRQAVAAAMQPGGEGAAAWLNELIWREFYIQMLYHSPRIHRESFDRSLATIPWRDDPDEFEAWKSGGTGVPIVDAAMRQLRQTGWMHNRLRMIAASYLVKDLLINWQWGERWFMENLIDGDPAANNGGWQWTAGTGADAAPYFRIFNPVLQSRRFDPHGAYIRRWLPELAHLSDAYIHAPWEKGFNIPGYPQRPLVDHAQAVQRARLVYRSSRIAFSAA